MRQRLSSEPDRYRGRRRVPTPPRSRYAAVVTTAFVGAGLVALGAQAMPDAKTITPAALADMEQADLAGHDLAERAAEADRASRGSERSAEQAQSGIWQLPLRGYELDTPYGMQGDTLHGGIDLVAPEGTPYNAVHAGKVTKAGWFGGYGYAVIVQHPDGTEAIYGHSSQITVTEGQEVKAGEQLGLVGATGHAYGAHLHLELHLNGSPINPMTFLADRGVDLDLEVEPINTGN